MTSRIVEPIVTAGDPTCSAEGTPVPNTIGCVPEDTCDRVSDPTLSADATPVPKTIGTALAGVTAGSPTLSTEAIPVEKMIDGPPGRSAESQPPFALLENVHVNDPVEPAAAWIADASSTPFASQRSVRAPGGVDAVAVPVAEDTEPSTIAFAVAVVTPGNTTVVPSKVLV